MRPYDSWWLLMTLDDALWLLMTSYDSWWLLILLMILDDSWWHLMTPDDSWLFINLDDFWWFLITLDDSWMLRWLIKTCKDSCQRTLNDYCATIINSLMDDFGQLFMLQLKTHWTTKVDLMHRDKTVYFQHYSSYLS